ncbi:ATP-binding cassette, subfamily A (ABC1), member 3 [Paragonimus westermani]|uniref:ATP-binding cassette, subfamily A (ABC1), member 3 n=1 Tax=Paragonimus westermani TaxID=34504 RepID=A0A5J4NP05_9TREM|nr:ATP-binding cassette, subfamily A (ABC1), member 3 [Paragonimus westermani]
MYKFCIVLGKNYRLFYRAWIQTLIIILLPVALASALVFLRNESARVQIPSAVHWEPFSLNTLPPPPVGHSVWVLAYAPNISLCNEVMQAAAQNLSLVTMPFVSEDELLRFLQLAGERRSPNNVLGAVIFNSFNSTANVSYTIRLPNTIEWQTRMLYPKFAEGKPRTFDSYASPPAYHSSGFLSIQSTIDQVIAQLFCGGNISSMPEIDMKLQRMPFPPYLDDGFIPIIQRQLSLVIVLGFTFPVLHAIRLVLVEKQERVKETLKMLGMSNGIYWCSWLTAYLSLFAILNALLTALLCLNCSKNGPILAASNPLLIYMLLMLYAFSLLTFGFAISTFFDSPHTGTAIGCAILILVFLPYALLDEHYVELNLATKLISSFLPSVGMGFVCMLIGQFEGTGLGVQFSSLASSANPGDNLSLDMLWIVFLIEGKLFMLFTLYVDAVRPGKYGVPKPWHFPFTYFCRKKPTSSLSLSVSAEETGQSDLDFALNPPERKQNSVQVAGTSRSSGSYSLCPSEHQSTCALRKPSCSSDNVLEADPVGLAIGISLINVRKVYASKQAVNAAVSGLTMNIFQGQITVLLGHNGAGKTTTLSILTGLYPPTSGTAFVNGYNIQKDIESVRKSLGFCPQEDVYFKNFTVEEHLILVARLKGYGGSELKSEVRKILQQTRLTHKRYAFAGTLSGGMRRRLSIGMALIGDSKVVILDEPTSGLDPEARRHVWTILQAARATRTVLVTTHYMDEADHLGDRIAILAAGKLQCFGSPLFLKAKYGAGYLLTVNKREDVQPEHLLSRVQLFVPGAYIRMHQGEELKVLLPLDSVGQFAALFSDLETNKAELGIYSFGTSVTTMEEVFFRVSEQDNGAHRTAASGRSSTCEGDDSVSVRPRTPIDVLSDMEDSLTVQSCYTYSEIREMRNHGFSLYWQQLTALSIKRGIYALRHRLLILSQIVIPLVLSLFALLIFRHLTVLVQADNPSLLVSLTSFVDQASGSEVVVSYANANNETESSVAEQLLWTYTKQFDPLSHIYSRRMQQPDSYEDNLINEVGRVNLFQYRGEYIIGLVVDSFPVSNSTYSIALRGYFQGESFHSAPASLNAVTNAVLRLFVNRSSRYPHECPALHPVPNLSPHVSTYNHPLPRTDAERAQRLNTTDGLIVSLVASVPLVSNLLLALSYLAATFSMALIHEYNTRAKHLQFVSGVKLPIIGLLVVAILSYPSVHQQELSYSLHYFWVVISPTFSLAYGLLMVFENYQFRRLCDHPEMEFLCLFQPTMPCCLICSRLCYVYFGCGKCCSQAKHDSLSTFQGDEDADRLVEDEDVRQHRHLVESMPAQQSMGYCPQFDALLPYLTGRETLQLYARLRGIREDILNVEVDQLLYDLGLSHYANVRVDTYSGGKRRKLSVAVALVGGTPLVCLDEPTSGVDPVSRRRMWHLLRRCRRQGRTLVLSSHSMEECEALCSRVSIFVNGRLKCLGTCQHLKTRFGRGYSLTLQVAAPPHLTGSSSTDESLQLLVTSDSVATSLAEDLSHAQQVAFDHAVNQAMRFVQEQFPVACLVDRHQGVVHYHLPITTSDNFCLGDVFRLMESNKVRLGLVNYSISQTSLEQVFIDLAKLQEEYTTDNQSATSTDLRRPHCLRRTCRLCVDCARCSCCRPLSSSHELEIAETESLFATR